MPYVYLITTVIFSSLGNIMATFYNKKNSSVKDPVPLYNVVYVATTLLSFSLMYIFDFSFDPSVLLYSLAFGTCYAASTIGGINALKHGSVALTTLVVQLSLIAVTIWGFFFWGAEFNLLVASGIILVVLSLVLCIYKKEENDSGMINPKWLFWVSLGFLGNTGCTILQRTQQMQYEGKHGKMLMVFALIIALGVCLTRLLLSRKKEIAEGYPCELKKISRRSLIFPVITGVANAMVNLFVMLLAGTDLSPSIIYPAIAIGALSIVTLFSVIVFGERLSTRRWIGVAIGIAAIIILNL